MDQRLFETMPLSKITDDLYRLRCNNPGVMTGTQHDRDGCGHRCHQGHGGNEFQKCHAFATYSHCGPSC